MFAWDDLRFFLALQRAGTLARAAAALRVDATTVGRRLAALEETVGAKLVDKTPEGYVLTRAGHGLLPHAERMESEALALERLVRGADQRLAGTVRVSVTEMLATRFLVPHLARFAREHPEVALELHCSNRPVHLGRREADIAVRLAKPEEPDVLARPLAPIPLGLYGSKRYLATRGAPAAPDERLDGHTVVLFAATRSFRTENAWLEQRLGDARVALRSDSVSSIYAAVEHDLGLALLPRVVAERDPSLVYIPTRTAPEPRMVYRAVHRDLARSARVRAVLSFLGDIVRREPAPDAQ